MNNGYSVTQGVNFAQMSVAVGIIIRIWTDPATITAEEWQVVGLAVVALVAAVVGYFDRLSKGDVTVGGFKK